MYVSASAPPGRIARGAVMPTIQEAERKDSIRPPVASANAALFRARAISTACMNRSPGPSSHAARAPPRLSSSMILAMSDGGSGEPDAASPGALSTRSMSLSLIRTSWISELGKFNEGLDR